MAPVDLSPNVTTRQVCTVRLSDVTSRPVEWLWPGRIPIGKLTLVSGDPGLGKSYVTLSVAAHVTRETQWPDGTSAPSSGNVILLSAEDDVEDTIKPRLESMGADHSLIVAINGVRCSDGGRREFDLLRDLDPLRELVSKHPNTRLIVVDPISAYCGRTDSHKNAEVRAMLAPLATLAAEHAVAIVAVNHLSKGVGGKAVYRSMGSLAFAAAPRAVWHVGRDRDDSSRRLLLPVKMNISPEATGLAFRIIDGRVEWESQPIRMHADDLLAAETDRQPSDAPEREQAEQFLRELSAAGPVLAFDVQRHAGECGFSAATIRRAKKGLCVVVKREGFGVGGSWHWALPASIDARPPK
jgi:putative DNA primase/helicase